MKDRIVWTVFVCVVAAGPALGVSLGHVDDFEDATVQGWVHGLANPNSPTNQPAGGNPGRYLELTASGGAGPGSKLLALNTSANWSGDYTAAGVDTIEVDLRTTDSGLTIFIALNGAGGQYATAGGFALPDDGAWHGATFDISAGGLVSVGGADAAATLAGVTELRLLHSSGGPSWLGDTIAAGFDADNVKAAAALAVESAGVPAESWRLYAD